MNEKVRHEIEEEEVEEEFVQQERTDDVPDGIPGAFDSVEEKAPERFQGFVRNFSALFGRGSAKKGIGYTRKDKSETKAAKKAASKQRAVNRKRASKKSRPTGSKQRK